MFNRLNKGYITIWLAVLLGSVVQAQVSFQTKEFKLSLDAKGRVTELTNLNLNKNYLYAEDSSYLMSIRKNGILMRPEALQWKNKSSEIVLSYSDKTNATVKVKRNSDYISFELKGITNALAIEIVLWGPFATTIGDTVGEVVGVVRNKDFALGIQALNVKTLGGYPSAESDIQPSYDVFTNGNKVDVSKDDLNKQLFRGDVAMSMSFGSTLQAYCRNRYKDRVVENWGHSRYLAPGYQDGGIIGSKVALFGVAAPNVLNTISAIEINEKLPHPLLDGVWGKQSQNATESYLIMSFGESDLQEAIDMTKEAGLRYLYHEGPFESWGHFKLDPKQFPNNWESLKECVSKAKAQEVRVGLHTLSNFITTNDPYVTPVPDKRLAKVGYSVLTEDINMSAKDIPIKDPAFFNQFENNTLRACVVGDEIIRYHTISSSAPWKLVDCQRGAFGTKVEVHKANDSIGKLMDHPYKVFLGNHDLDQEIARTVARLFNETGLMQISFDGLEGCWSEGMGDYGKQLFTETWFHNLKPELQGKVINDASNPGHYFWHIYTRMNWGEPWYAGFRESQLQLRLKNQQFFRRNLMPSMLGWFSLRPETSIEDIEWMLARGAGFNAGFGLSTSVESLKRHGRKDEILSTIKLWEGARLQGLFTEEQQQRMQDPKNEFHLQMSEQGAYELEPIYNIFLLHEQKVKQPGEPTYSSFEFTNPTVKQPAGFIITMGDRKDDDTEVSFDNPTITINQQDALVLPIKLKRGQIVYCDGQVIKVYNKQWQLIETLKVSKPLPVLDPGKNEVTFDGQYSSDNGPNIKIELRCKGIAEVLRSKNNKTY